jgi:photosystem II stability/assembly factor-like uncharacterized protein
MSLRISFAFALFLSLLTFSLSRAEPDGDDEPKGGPAEFKRLKFRSIGPATGGRVSRSCGVPGDPLTYYAATAAGGVWKSSDGGIRWKAIFDDQPVSSIGSIAVASSDPNVLYVGSGEANIRGNVEPGVGIFKSTDAGKTWKHQWKVNGQIGAMIVHPTNPNVAYAAVLGNAFGPSEDRGVYRTTDGKTWKRVLFKDKDTGASDVCFDPSNPNILFAGLWQTRRKPWEMTSGGPGSGLFQSRDGGDTWTRLVAPPDPDSPDAAKDAPEGQKRCEGLPEGIWGKICLAVAPSDGRRVYAMIEAEKGGLFRSDDGGATWTLINGGRGLRQRAWYFSTITVHPTNPDLIWCPQVPLLRSINGGKSFQRVKGQHHGDHHDIWIDPKNPQRIIDSNDGGVDISLNGGETWHAPPLPIAQFYHVACDTRTPYYVMGAMQDVGTAAGPSNSLLAVGIRPSDWYTVGGGEAGFVVPDTSDPNIVYAGEYGGYITRYDRRVGQARSVGVYPYDPSGHGAEDLRYRFQWTAPILVSPHDSKVVYHAANVLFKTSNGGLTWQPISGDLTRNDKAKQKWSGGPITGDNTGVEVYCTIFAVAESPKQPGLIWAGSDDGLVHVTHDGGKNWSNVTPNIKGIPEWGTVLCIEPSPFDAETAYVVVDNHRLDDLKPYLFKTTDGGKTWTNLAGKLAQDVFLRSVREDPKKKDILYLGTERGIQFSTDGGANWRELKLNLPTVAVTDLVVKNDDLVVGTNGRSIWIFDDLTPLREWTPKLASEAVHLFSAQPAHRYRYHVMHAERAAPGVHPNPPAGAVFHYQLKAKPKGDIAIEVLDADGKAVVTLSSKEEPKEVVEEGDYAEEEPLKPQLKTEAGLHRVVWDLHRDGAEVIRGAKLDGGNPKHGPLLLPGVYTVKLVVEGKALTTKLEVLLDTRERIASDKDDGPAGKDKSCRACLQMSLQPGELQEQQALELKMIDDITRLTRTVEQMRTIKQQLNARSDILSDDAKAEGLVKASKEFIGKIDELEERMHNPKARIVYDILALKGGAQLYSQLAWLLELLKDSDGKPTQGVKEVYEEQALVLKKLELEWKVLLASDLVKLNELAKKLELPGVIVPPLERKKEVKKEK